MATKLEAYTPARHRKIVTDLTRALFKVKFETAFTGSLIESAYRGRVIDLSPSRDGSRNRSVDFTETNDALTAAYRGYTPRLNLIRDSAAIRFVKEEPEVRVLPHAEADEDLILFAQFGSLKNREKNARIVIPDQQQILSPWYPLLREAFNNAKNER